MRVVVSDDYQGAVATLDCFSRLDTHEVTIHRSRRPERRRHCRGALLRRGGARPDPRADAHVAASSCERLPALRLIAQTGRGIPHIDLDACTEHGVAVAVGGGSPVAPAELTWALVLAVMTAHPARDRGEFAPARGRRRSGRISPARHSGSTATDRSAPSSRGTAGLRDARSGIGREGSQARAATDGIETGRARRSSATPTCSACT